MCLLLNMNTIIHTYKEEKIIQHNVKPWENFVKKSVFYLCVFALCVEKNLVRMIELPNRVLKKILLTCRDDYADIQCLTLMLDLNFCFLLNGLSNSQKGLVLRQILYPHKQCNKQPTCLHQTIKRNMPNHGQQKKQKIIMRQELPESLYSWEYSCWVIQGVALQVADAS